MDISGKEPIVKAKFDIVQPISVVPSFDEIIVIGTNEIVRLKIPE
jgi:hypothetical protein